MCAGRVQGDAVKTDRKDARGIAQLMRLGWFRPVHCKSLPAQETRALLSARKLVQAKLHDMEMSLRGILRGFGLKIGATTPRTFEGRERDLVTGHPTLLAVTEALLAARAALGEQLSKLEKRVRSLARDARRARRLMSAPGVGAIVALTFVAAIDDPARFRSSKAVGAHFGLTPKKYQSGETDVTGRISKIGDEGVRTALYEAADVILTRPVKGSSLKGWAARLAARGSGPHKVKHASLDWPADPHSGTIRWRPSADPGQKSETEGRISSKGGLTPKGQLQKSAFCRPMARAVKLSPPSTGSACSQAE